MAALRGPAGKPHPPLPRILRGFETGKIPIEVLNERLTAIQEERAHVEGLRDTAATLARREVRHQKVPKKATKPALSRRFLREVLLEGEETEQLHLLRSFVREIQVHPDALLIRYNPFVITEGHPFDPDDSGEGPGSPGFSREDDGVAVSLVARGTKPPRRVFSTLNLRWNRLVADLNHRAAQLWATFGQPSTNHKTATSSKSLIHLAGAAGFEPRLG